MARSRTENLFADSDDSEYKAAPSEDSESDKVFAAPAKGKPNPEGTGKKLQRKEKVGNETAAAKDPRLPAKKK